MNVLSRLGVALKAAASSFVMSFGRAGGTWGNWRWGGNDAIDYGRVGSGRSSSIVAATLGWLSRKWPNGVLSMRKLLADGSFEDVPTHEFLALLKRPNPFYSGSTMGKAALNDWTATGDAYLLKVRNALGKPVQLWYAPSYMVEPISKDPTVFVEYFNYSPSGERPIRLDPADVVHIRNGIDPDNVRKGLSPMAAIVREIFTDEEASQYTAAMLVNSGIPRVVISPDMEEDIPPEAAEEIKGSFKQRFGGENRGDALVIGSKVKITPLSFNPKDMDLGSLRDLAEERITAVLGIPAVVVGMGSGLDSATYSNLASLREVAIEDNLLPTYMVFAEELAAQLLGDFESNPDQYEVYYDVSGIRELQPDMDKMVEREALKLRSGGITINEFRANTGEEPLDNGDVLLIPAAMVPTPLDAIVPVPLALPTPIRAVAGRDGPESYKLLDAGLNLDDGVNTKALGVMQSIVSLRARLLDPETRALAGLLRKQRDLAISVLDDVVKDAGPALGLETKETDPAVFAARLAALLEAEFAKGTQTQLERAHLRAALGVHDLVGTWAGVDVPIDAALRQRYLRDAGVNVSGITETTLDSLNKTIRASVFAGETPEELTARIRGLHVFDDSRAETIAYNELAQATNRAALQSYRQTGIVEAVHVHDGTANDAECSAMNGRIIPIDEAGGIPLQQHVNCQRSFSPLTRAEALSNASANHNGHVEQKELVLA